MKLLYALTLAALSAVASSFSIAPCGNELNVRLEWRDMTSAQKETFTRAYKKVHSSGVYARFVDLHKANNMAFHRGPHFMVQHRAMLYFLEQELRKVEPEVIIPYWDFSLDAGTPTLSSIWEDFGKGRSGECVTNSIFGDWVVNGRCIRRGFSYGGESTSLVAFQVLAKLIQDAKSFDYFSYQIEYGAHAHIHIMLGGDAAVIDFSPCDPLFFLIHAYIDKLYFSYQNYDSSRKFLYTGNEYGISCSANDILKPWNLPVSTFMDTEKLCYMYVNPNTKWNASDRKNNNFNGTTNSNSTGYLPPKPKPISEESCRKLHYPVDDIKKCAERVVERYGKVEEIYKQGGCIYGPGYNAECKPDGGAYSTAYPEMNVDGLNGGKMTVDKAKELLLQYGKSLLQGSASSIAAGFVTTVAAVAAIFMI